MAEIDTPKTQPDFARPVAAQVEPEPRVQLHGDEAAKLALLAKYSGAKEDAKPRAPDGKFAAKSEPEAAVEAEPVAEEADETPAEEDANAAQIGRASCRERV